jgi:enamine deaminase RidA (YjgF/YER057c/UK114 family)
MAAMHRNRASHNQPRETDMPAIRRLLLDDQPEPVSHYCHVVRAGNLIWVSGTVGMAADGSIPNGVVAQFDLAIRNLDACLKAAGGGPEHVVKVTVFLTDVDDRKRINPARQRYFGEHRPASTLVEVSALVLPELLVEIEAQAVLPD